MGKTGVLGSFEELVLLAVHHTGEDAYAVTIRRSIAQRTRSDVAMGTVYGTLDRLEEKGLVESRIGDATEARRGRPRRYYRLLPAGRTALEASRRVRERMWEGAHLGSDSRLEGA